MAETHVVSALKENGSKSPQKESDSAMITSPRNRLGALRRRAKALRPTVQISDIGPRKVPQALADMWRYWAGDLGHATKDHYAARRPSFVPS